MKLSDNAEEILETLWVRAEEEKQASTDVGIAKGEPAIDELCKSGYVKLIKDQISLTEKGKKEGRLIVRRHRLAERLSADILDVKKKLVHPISCRFEHLLHEGLEENICILLGHPKFCPHGKPIPEGECCRKSKENIGKTVSALDRLDVNQKGKIAYIHTKDRDKLQKLMAMGVLPGITINSIQKYPSYVFQIGQSQFAIDKELASSIYVRLSRPETLHKR
ncbi:MAG: metal-dependent transcriptional regulator [Kiritimatiellia bacterium]|jgi:DtxR family Mn-dependent transcriptional regulator